MKILLSIIAFATIASASVSKTNHADLKYYVDTETNSCELSQNLVEKTMEKTYKNQDQALDVFLKDADKYYKNSCKVQKVEDGGVTVSSFSCSNKKGEDIDIVFFSDKETCVSWNETRNQREVRESENDNTKYAMRNNQANIAYIFNVEENKCVDSIEMFNKIAESSKESEYLKVKNSEEYVENFFSVFNSSEAEIRHDFEEDGFVVKIKQRTGENVVFVYGKTKEICEKISESVSSQK